ncbi:phosphoribosylglycinamide formyltransferase [Paenibacillus glycanilyticus]|uniref:Phosphoribosylglycinamide formyltransferase n=1 Tax=Paenibacillus glycanilyticus TaxID=126569 RepID=A0ABQ6NF22_9BACL|nr:MmcQ/YjbR family DNA-binding protein [Paenibacillus glycanilyticus]GMK43647.1 phosphoribosylglycinamide formyltransferase [Paenibacillus glycanilyticus]
MKTELGKGMLEQVQGICSALPEVDQIVDGFGHDVMKVRGKTFIMMGEGHNSALPSLSIKATKEQQYLLLEQGGYVKTPYIGHHGWVSVDMEAGPNWDELNVLIQEAYLLAAPKRLVKQVLDSVAK